MDGGGGQERGLVEGRVECYYTRHGPMPKLSGYKSLSTADDALKTTYAP